MLLTTQNCWGEYTGNQEIDLSIPLRKQMATTDWQCMNSYQSTLINHVCSNLQQLKL